MFDLRKISLGITILFSFFLGFGKLDPFGTNGLYFDVLTILALFSIAISTNVLSSFSLYRKQLIYLFLLVGLFTLTGLLYGYSVVDHNLINIKLIAAIIIFWFFSYLFKVNPRFGLLSIILFSVSCALIAVLYQLGVLSGYSEVRNGRLYIFEENPNSISARMAIALIIIMYVLVENPLGFRMFRWILGLTIPSMFFFIVETGSRGSFLALILGLGLIIYFSNVKKFIKVLLVISATVVTSYAIYMIQDSSLFARLSADNITESREEIWGNALEIFYDNPWGVGEGGYFTEMTKRYSSQKDTHNLFVYIIICGGWLGLTVFLFFLKDLFATSLKQLKIGNSLLFIIFIFLMFLASKTGGIITYLIMWYFFAVINSFNYKIANNEDNNNSGLAAS